MSIQYIMKNFNYQTNLFKVVLDKYYVSINNQYNEIKEYISRSNPSLNIQYNQNMVIVSNWLKHKSDPNDTIPLINILKELNTISEVKQKLTINATIVTKKMFLDKLSEGVSETKGSQLDKLSQRIFNNADQIIKDEQIFIDNISAIIININNGDNDDGDVAAYISLIKSLITDLDISVYLMNVIINVLYKYKCQESDIATPINEFIKLLYKKVVSNDTAVKTWARFKYNNMVNDTPTSSSKNDIKYSLDNLIDAAKGGRMSMSSGLNWNIINRLKTIEIVPKIPKVYLLDMGISAEITQQINDLKNVALDGYNVRLDEPKELLDKYTDWKETDEIIDPSKLIRVINSEFYKVLSVSDPKSVSDFGNLVCGVDNTVATVDIFTSYMAKAISLIFAEGLTKQIIFQNVSSFSNTLFANSKTLAINYMQETHISNLVNIRSSALSFQRKIVNELRENTVALKRLFKDARHSNKKGKLKIQLMSLFKAMVQKIADPPKSTKSKFVEKVNGLFPKSNLKTYTLKFGDTSLR